MKILKLFFTEVSGHCSLFGIIFFFWIIYTLSRTGPVNDHGVTGYMDKANITNMPYFKGYSNEDIYCITRYLKYFKLHL